MVKRLSLLILSLALVFFAPLSAAKPATALSKADLRFYAQNNIMFIDDEDSLLSDCLNGDLVDLGDNSKTALNFLIQKGYSTSSAAAIVGNLIAESSVVPNKKEGGELITDESWRLTDWEKFGSRGFGIAQWTSSGRQTSLQNFADANGLPVISMEAQLGYLFDELQREVRGSGSSVANMNSVSLEEATFFMYRKFETPRSSFCTSNDGAGCYNNYAPSSYSELSETETSSAYSAFMNRLKYAKSALAEVGDLTASTVDGSATTPLSSLTCSGITGGSAGSKKIVETAVSMSWPNSDGNCESAFGLVAWKSRASGGVQACSDTLNSVAKLAQKAVGGLSLRDCGKFVGAVMNYGGIDTSFPKVGVRSQMAYMNSSNKWTKVSTDGEAFSMSNLQPGDVLAYSAGSGDATAGHIQIWIGEQSVKGAACPGGTCKVNIASASYQSWTPSLNYTSRTSTTYDGVKYYYSVYRFAASPETNTPAAQVVSDSGEVDGN
ncbi:hypothetical protein IKE71_01195 [Candidatus Saccharibacteria bacterium]|nr:hypothetical protein [Candidatus Saccharibacteria bacterium]